MQDSKRSKSKRSISRQKFIQAATPVSRVNLPKKDYNRTDPSKSDRQTSARDSHQKTRNHPPPIKEFRSYAQVRQESKQRQVNSHRSLEATSD